MRPTTPSGSIAEDDWLSGVFSHPVFAIGERVPGAAVLEHASARAGAATYYVRVPTGDLERLLELVSAGLYVVDVNVTLSRLGPAPEAESPAAEVGEFEEADTDALLDIAGTCFRYSRFHLDPSIPNEIAHTVKREWIRSYVEGRRGIQLLVARGRGRPLGFLAVAASELDGKHVRIIDLIGVATEERGRGIGRALVSTFVEEHAGQCDELRVGTQIANVSSLRLYEALGFSVVGSSYVLHLHAHR